MPRLLVPLLPCLLLACTTPSSPTPAAQASGTLSVEEGTAMCVKLHEQLAQCAEPFIDLMLELRTKHQPGFAEVLADPRQREEIRRAGIAEALEDGTGDLARRTAKCRGYAENGPPAPASDPATLEACYQKPDCNARIACIRPVLEVRTAARNSGR